MARADDEDLRSPAFGAEQFGLGLSYDDYAVMGLVSTMFSDLDLTWSFLIWSLLAKCDVITTHCADPAAQFQRVGAAVTATLSFRRKIDLAVALAIERFGGDNGGVATLQRIGKQCARLEEQRNTIIHSWWSPYGTPEEGVDVTRTTRTKHGLDRKKGLTMSRDDGIKRAGLLELAERMQGLVHDLHEIRMEMYPRSPRRRHSSKTHGKK